MNNLVSIIIPIYNSEKYLNECMEAIESQTYRYIEILCVDNGSVDKSLDILREHEIRDKRIKILKTNEKGVSRARNLGINNADGEYIMFVDSDDLIDKKAVEKMIGVAIRQNSDIVLCTNSLINTKGKERKLSFELEYSSEDNLVKNEQEHTFEYMYKKGLGIQIWNRIIKRDILISNNIRFDENMSYDEDMFFSWKTVIYSNIINIISEDLYKYRLTKSSAIMKYHNNLKEKYDIAFNEIKSELHKKGVNECYINEIISKIYNDKVQVLITMEVRSRKGFKQKIKSIESIMKSIDYNSTNIVEYNNRYMKINKKNIYLLYLKVKINNLKQYVARILK